MVKSADDFNNEKQELELELLRHQVQQLKIKKDTNQAKHETVEADLRAFANQQRATQSACNHHKGGIDLEGVMGRGSDPQFSVVKHQLPLGDFVMVCQRCQKTVGKDSPEYDTWLRLPTKNSPSSSMVFSVSGNAKQ